MNEQKFRHLLDRYFQHTLTDDEAEWLNRFDGKMLKKKEEVFKDEKHRHLVKSSLYKAIRKRQKYSNALWRVAAGLLILIGLVTTVLYFNPIENPEESVKQITYTTQWGETQDIILPDGTNVKLNAGSSISYPEKFTPTKRNVRLRGEAFFDVVKQKESPFIIQTNEVTTTVLGTSFNINTEHKEHITVTVATGKVRVASNYDNEVILTSKHQATYNPTTQTISTREVNLDNYLDWKAGILRFENVTIAEASKKLERWYNARITILSDDVANCRFSGKFNNEALNTVLESLKNLKINMKYSILDNGEIEIKGTCN